MAVDLVRKEDGENLNLSNQIWGFILQTAEENGWEPEGTSLLDEETEEEKKNWDTSDYSSNEGQSVEEEDAENIANALKIYLDKVDSPNPVEVEAINKFLALIMDNFLLLPAARLAKYIFSNAVKSGSRLSC